MATKLEAMMFTIFLPFLAASLVQAAPMDTKPLPFKGPGVYYTEANGTVGGTIEDLLQELLERSSLETVDDKVNTRERHARALGCSATPVYGSASEGFPFVDFPSSNPWPCGVDITGLIIRYGCVIDSIQVVYKTYDGTSLVGQMHGGKGGVETIITFDDGERIISVAGTVTPVFVQQLTFVTQKESGELNIYGPYGGCPPSETASGMFLVHGKIDSIFGRADSAVYVNAIGFYFEEEGVHANWQ